MIWRDWVSSSFLRHYDETQSLLKSQPQIWAIGADGEHLKLTAATPANPGNSEHAFRAKLLNYLAEQRALAEAEIAGTPFQATKKITRTNEAGEKVRVDAPRQVRKGWFTDATGKMFFQLKYGSKPLEFAKGTNAVSVQDLKEVPVIIGSIIEAIHVGELDPQLTAAIAERKANFKPKAKKAAA